MDYRNSIVCQVIPEIDAYSSLCIDLLRDNSWSETAIDLTQSISDYKTSDQDLSDLVITLEVFFILESSIIKIANEPISKFASVLNSYRYSDYMHLYILNELTHAKFYRNLYIDIVAHDKVVDEDHVKQLYDKYNAIECFMRRVSSIESTLENNSDDSCRNMTWVDFVNLAATEGIKFMSGFHNIFYYSRDGNMMAVNEGNRWVTVDELIHALNHLFTANYLRKLVGISTEEFLRIVTDTIKLFIDDEIEFSIIMYPNTAGENMFRYIKWLGQELLNKAYDICGVTPVIIYDDAKLPAYMEIIELEIKESLHETINTNYTKIDKINIDLDELDLGFNSFDHLREHV